VYRTDLARIHHEGFGGFARRAAPGLLAILRTSNIRPGSLVVDLGCGSGIWPARLDLAGYRAIGIDQSRAFVRLARTVAPRCQLRVGSVHRVALPRCQAVTALGEVLSYLPAPLFGATFRRVARALTPGGVFVFDIMIGQPHPANYRNWIASGRWAVGVAVRENPARTRLVRQIDTFWREGRGYRRRREIHRLRLANPRDVRAGLRATGFRCRTVTGYGRYPLAPGRLGFVAIKRA